MFFFKLLYVQKYMRLLRKDKENRKGVEISLLTAAAIEKKGDNEKLSCSPSCVFKNLAKIAQKVLNCIDKTGIFHQNINLKSAEIFAFLPKWYLNSATSCCLEIF